MVDDVASVGRLDVVSLSVPIFAVQTLLELFRSPKIKRSLPSGPGAQP